MKNKTLVTEEQLFSEDHFEYEVSPGMTPDRFGSMNHADTGFGNVNEGIGGTVGQVFGSFIGQGDAGKKSGAETSGKIGDFVSGIFGGKKEDKSDTGFKSFLTGFNGLPFYPTKDEVIAAAQQAKWDPAEPAAIQNSYNPQSGQWKRGDWNFQITGTSPITVTQFKGANEKYVHSSTVNAKPPMNQSPNAAPVVSPYNAYLNSGQSQPQPTLGRQIANTLLSDAQQAIVNSLPQGTTPQQAQQALAQNGMPIQQGMNPYSASAGGFANSLFGGMSTGMSVGLILGFLALVALIIWFANK